MKNIQKLVLVPIEKWEKITDKDAVKEITVKKVHQTNLSPSTNILPPVKIVKNQKSLGKSTTSKTTKMFPFLSLKNRHKASNLFHYLDRKKIIKWNNNGEIVYKGHVIKNSNIIQLIKHAIQNESSKPAGMNFFYKRLVMSNIPHKLISNKLGLNIMNKSLQQDKYVWRPPGYVNK